MSTTIAILKFDPLTLELPNVPMIEDEVVIQLPPVHLTILDLSMGGAIDGHPHIGTDAPLINVTIKLTAPLALGTVIDMIVGGLDLWRDAWQAGQDAVKGKALL